MKNFKKLLAVLCSATLIVSSSLTAFAYDTTAGAGTIIAYRVDTVTVPTSVKLLFNPQGWKVTRWEGDTTGTQEQVVSLNYGITTESNFNKAVKVSFTATGGESSVENPAEIELVSTEAAATTNAGDDEYKLYLAVAPSDAAPKARGTGTGGADEAFGLDDDGASTATAGALSDVAMDAATDSALAFDGTAASSTADIAYLLNAATYKIADGKSIDFTTTNDQETLDDIFTINTIGSVVGFTFVGAMNDKVDWTKANLSSIAIQPEYEYVDAPASLEALDDAGYQQIDLEDFPETEVAPTTFTVTYNANYGDTPATATETVAADEHPSGTSTEIDALKTGNDGYTFVGWGASASATEEVDLDTISEATTLYAIWEEDEPAVTTYAMTINGSGHAVYDFAEAPTGSLTAVTVDGVDKASQIGSGVTFTGTRFKIDSAKVTQWGLGTGSHTIVATIGSEEYTFTIN